MRSKSVPIIPITRLDDGRSLPSFIELAHRHLQKERPKGDEMLTTNGRRFIVPLDLLRVVSIPETEISKIDEVALVYRRK